MFKAESGSSRFSSATATNAPSGRRGDQIARRGPTAGEIGFVGVRMTGIVRHAARQARFERREHDARGAEPCGEEGMGDAAS